MAGKFAPYILTVVIPVLVGAMIPHIGIIPGLSLILVSAVIGIADFAWQFSSKRHGKTKVLPILTIAVGAFILGGGIIWLVSPLAKDTSRPSKTPHQAAQQPKELSPIAQVGTPVASPALEPHRLSDGRDESAETVGNATTATTNSTLSPTQRSKKKVVELSADDFMKMYAGKTYEEQDRLTKLYKGDWLQITGAVVRIKGPNEDGEFYIFMGPRTKLLPSYSMYDIAITFDKRWVKRVAALKIGATLSVIGQIDRNLGAFITLVHSEIVGQESDK